MAHFYMNRRQMMVGGVSLLGALQLSSASRAQKATSVETKTKFGALRGKVEDGVAKFLGVPYAEAPVGALRFKAPQPLVPWSDVRDAVAFGNPSLQGPGQEMGPKGNGRMPAPSEDCLYLNIWTPAVDGKKRPVMFYNHGGGYMIGSGSATAQDGSALARLYDVVVVQSNHRLGALGYLFLADIAGSDEFAANQGMLDIAAALTWTSENIENFGGNPDNIMVFGESGGGAKTGCIYTMPGAATLFHKASIESSAPRSLATRDGATERARITLKNLGIAATDLSKLYDVSPDVLLKAQGADMGMGEAPWFENPPVPGLGAFVDGKIIPRNPFAQGVAPSSADKPLMVGTCRDELVFFALFGPPDIFSLNTAGLPKALATQMSPDLVDPAIAAFRASRPEATPAQLYFAITTSPIVRDSVRIAEAKVAQAAAPVYSYQLTYHSKVKAPGSEFELGSPHASDISMKFNTPETGKDFFFGMDQTPERYQTAKNMSALWASFAHNGKPGVDGLPDWPAYNLESRPTMWIDAECKVVNDPDPLERAFWTGKA